MLSLATNLRTRRARLNWSQKQLAQKAGVSQQLINALEKGSTRSSKFIREIAMALGCAISDLDPNYGAAVEHGQSFADLDGRHGELPIFGAAELAVASVLVSEEPIDFITRPHPLINVRGGYGIMVANGLMAPEFEAGDYALINPHLPPIANSTCLFYHERKEGSVGRIRRLVEITPKEWHVKAWHPPKGEEKSASLPRLEWSRCHRVVGRYFRR